MCLLYICILNSLKSHIFRLYFDFSGQVNILFMTYDYGNCSIHLLNSIDATNKIIVNGMGL